MARIAPAIIDTLVEPSANYPLKPIVSAKAFPLRQRVTNSCTRNRTLRQARLVLAAVSLCGTLCGNAEADRHCSPIQFRYYDARKALHETNSACPARLAKALELMREAAAEAGACGCLDAEEVIETFVSEMPAADADCAAAEMKILGLDEHMTDLVARCN